MSTIHINNTSHIGITNLHYQLSLRKRELERALAHIEKSKAGFPEGNLRICNRKGKPEYYNVTIPGDTKGQYIRKNQIATAEALAQKTYYAELEERIRKELANLNSLLALQKDTPETVWSKTSAQRQKLLQPLFLSDQDYKEMWLAETYETDPYYPEQRNKETEQGEFVRSKSEQFIANIYYEFGIPYRYEARLDLKNNVFKYPDFTLLDVPNRRVIYHEHLGLLDNEDYRDKNMKKLNLYAENGIFPGKNLILTYESEEVPFPVKAFRRMVEELLLGR